MAKKKRSSVPRTRGAIARRLSRAYDRSGDTPRAVSLTYIRSLTQTNKSSYGIQFRTRKPRKGPQIEDIKRNPIYHLNLKFVSDHTVERIRQSLPKLTKEQIERICYERKERRRVMFANGFAGSRKHRLPSYTASSLVRC